MKDNDFAVGVIVILGIIGVALMGGVKNNQQTVTAPATSNNPTIEEQIDQSNKRASEISQEISDLQKASTESRYKGLVSISYINRSSEYSQEYVVIRTNAGTTTIPVTGWTIKSLSTGNSVSVSQGVYLYFSNSLNSKNDIILTGNNVLYVITGSSPIGFSFQLNKCFGYLSQFQTFIPYIYTNCPTPRNMDLSSIPNRVENDSCFDYIDSFPSCKTQTDPLPNSWSQECKNFILNKINYNSCIGTYKNDKDFYLGDWRVYLARSAKLWKDRREDIELLDNEGKIVDELKY
jgi:hypothetical protein